MKQDLKLLLKITTMWLLACLMYLKFYYDVRTKRVLTGTYYAPFDFVIPAYTGHIKLIDVTLICVIEPERWLSIMQKTLEFEVSNLNIFILVTRKNKFKKDIKP
jgi:hypothetical protein